MLYATLCFVLNFERCNAYMCKTVMHLILQTIPQNWENVIVKTCDPKPEPVGTWNVKQGSAGLDVPCPMSLTIPAGKLGFKIHLGVRIMPEHHFWLVPRSSIAKTSLRMSNTIGLINVGYRGELIMCVDNLKPIPVNVLKGTRLCQIVSMNGSNISFQFGNVMNETMRRYG